MSAATDASLAAALFAVDPVGTGGACLRSLATPIRDQWLALLRQLLPPAASMRRIPCNIPDSRLLGGLDLVATLKSNRPIAERGVLAEADGGVVVLAMAERLAAGTAARLNAVLDAGEVMMPREGVSLRNPARVGIVALDEGMSEDERTPASLLDRLGFLIDLDAIEPKARLAQSHAPAQVLAARALLPQVACAAEVLEALCSTAAALGIASLRGSLLALRAARAAAALDGRIEITMRDAVLAGRLVLAPRATRAPPAEEVQAGSEEEPQAAPEESAAPEGSADAAESADAPEAADATAEPDPGSARKSSGDQPLAEVVLAAAQAAIPAGLLAHLRSPGAERTSRAASLGRIGALRASAARGRPAGVRAGAPRGSARLNVIETLRAAAPWQALRRQAAAASMPADGHRRGDCRVFVGSEDFRVTRYLQRTQTLTIFVVDASGSAALNRLAEAKGAVELLLADCYVRRDQVAVIGFRGRKAELLLPPTRSLVRAKRSLAALPGGGGTPLATAIEAARSVAELARRRGDTPTLVLLTDGRANVARDGTGGRETAHAHALLAARGVGLARIAALFIDTSSRPNALAREIASGMHAEYLALPYANAKAVSSLVKTAVARA
jgi:magnesium chelatase subunit D